MSPPTTSIEGQYGVAEYAIPSDPKRARLIVDPNTLEVVTLERACSTRSAASRGLAQYLAAWSLIANGQRVGFTRVLDQWADTEEEAKYPSAAVLSPSEVLYGPSTPEALSPSTNDLPIEGTEFFWSTVTQVQTTLAVDVWCSSEREREGVSRLMEDALSPVDWMYGMRLVLPFYHGVHCVYEPLSVTYADIESDAATRYRRATWSVRADLQQVRIRGRLPRFRTETRITTSE